MTGPAVRTGYDGVVRPEGVYQRFLELREEREKRARRHPEYRLRSTLASFISLCGRRWYADHPVSRTLDAYYDVILSLDDPGQVRTHSDFEERCIVCIEQLRPEVLDFAKIASSLTFEEEDAADEPLLRIPPMVLLGEVDEQCYFHMVCWNDANCVVEEVVEPYWAARGIANMGFFEPDDPYEMVGPCTALAERYEDFPPERDATAAKITDLLTTYLTKVPWPKK
jgi:hypothetical protein